MGKLRDLSYKSLEHPLSTPQIWLCQAFTYSQSSNFLTGKCFSSDQEVTAAYFVDLTENHLNEDIGIGTSIEYITLQGDYVEK